MKIVIRFLIGASFVAISACGGSGGGGSGGYAVALTGSPVISLALGVSGDGAGGGSGPDTYVALCMTDGNEVQKKRGINHH